MRVLGVYDRFLDDFFQKRLQNITGFVVDESRYTLDATAAGQSSDVGLGDAVYVVAQNLAVALRASQAIALLSESESMHDVSWVKDGWYTDRR
jgi:ApbE superfamily uncharacterized protein (UPF0280 family)